MKFSLSLSDFNKDVTSALSMIKKHLPKKEYSLLVIAINASILSILPVLLGAPAGLAYSLGVLGALLMCMVVGIYLRSYYTIDTSEGLLKVYFLFRVKTVSLTSIIEIIPSDSPMSGFRYALHASNGLLIKTGRWDEFFINPVDVSTFVKDVTTWQEAHQPEASKVG